MAVGITAHGVGAVDDAGVDPRHHERRRPAAEGLVVHRTRHVRLPGGERLGTDAQRIRVREFGAQRGVLADFFDDIEQARHGAARGAAPHLLDPQAHALERLTVALHGLPLQHLDAEIGRDRIETAAVHDARTARAGCGLMTQDHAPDPLHLAGEVAVVGAGRGAGGDQRLAVQRIGAHGRDHDAGGRAQLAQTLCIGGIDHDRGERGRTELRLQGLETGGRAAGDRPAQAAVRRTVAIEQVADEDAADEARGTEDDDVVHGPLPGLDQKLLSAVALPSAPNQTQPLPSMAPWSRTNM